MRGWSPEAKCIRGRVGDQQRFLEPWEWGSRGHGAGLVHTRGKTCQQCRTLGGVQASVLGKQKARPLRLQRAPLPTGVSLMFGVTPRGNCCLFSSPSPPDLWRCERAGGWGLAAKVYCARAGCRSSISSPSETSNPVRAAPRGGPPTPFRPVVLGGAPLRRISRPPWTSLSAPRLYD